MVPGQHVFALQWSMRWLGKKDREDIEGVIAVQGDALDWQYIHRWCDRHGTREAIEEIRRALSPLVAS